MLTLRQSPYDLFERLEQQVLNAERVPAAEVHENDQAYTIILELPGVDKESIEVKATDRTLLISAQRRSQHPASAAAQDKAPLHSEFRYGTWSRSFTFPGGLQRDALEAHYRDGLLTVTAPKAQTLTTVNVKVES
ncbi:Hsp20/alpha crystallin family protein [Synechococcus sp. CS-1324]|uniref:Hsp20/alpha crystallin family protein n=1 Tax=Synechococcus sp. CS-1324 TaxID=2847980 RepID=UPI000DB7B0C8|nr:Hsp20/alpha crystallin family protein [Synechococcus sp. CS-1324]MCT0230387.1 Hsp20/alpha crystallin family protein [Synechococcus sp. CS-1324]PZV05298.1 MAG: heat-shock protein [Cyanobium sp.]